MKFFFNPVSGSNEWRKKFAWLPVEVSPSSFIWLESYEMRRPMKRPSDVAMMEERRKSEGADVFTISLAPPIGG